MSDQESNVSAAVKANQGTISRFYQAFQDRNAEAMNACYAPDIKFSDPVFGPLEGDRVRAMWQMLNRPGGGGLELQYQVGAVAASAGSATWQAQYAAPGTGRPVDNHITSKFWFVDGLISRQEDTFDLWRWASMALGPVGRLLGWTPMVQGQIHKSAVANLDKFIRDRPHT
ncbi:MAG: nuclear transport factor 2 family protein [Candidatus Dormibacteraeota bacterium]|nr:nuclear transport factor 2 family protein [Candidatus Dormibacteraeota bacterium]